MNILKYVVSRVFHFITINIIFIISVATNAMPISSPSPTISPTTVNCNDLSHAVELETYCRLGTTDVCTLNGGNVYKISTSSSTATNSLPPIEINNAALCASNATLSGAPVTLYAQSFWVNGGRFQMGSATQPISSTNKLTVVMTGSNSAAPAPMLVCKDASSGISCSDIAKTSAITSNGRDITITSGGQFLVYGSKGATKNPTASKGYVHDLLNGKSFESCYQNASSCKTDLGTATDNLDLDPYFNTLVGTHSWTYLAMPAGPAYYNSGNWVQAPVDYSQLKVYTDPTLTTSATLPDPQYTLVLARDVTSDPDTGWQVGDWISVSTTGFSSHQTEIVQICSIRYAKNLERNTRVYSGLTNDPFFNGTTPENSSYLSALGIDDAVSVLELANTNCANTGMRVGTPLANYHFGGLMPTPGFFSNPLGWYTNSDGTNFNRVQSGQAYSLYDGALRNFGIDERAEVALLSRNVKFTSTAGDGSTSPSGYPTSQYYGGHLAVMHMGPSAPDEHVELVGVEIEKFGQGLVGRYPVHFHRLNNTNDSEDDNLLVQDVSVHHSYNKCFVPHETKGVKFYNNSCVRTIGQGVYLEDGYNIENNQFVRNLVAGVMGASLDYSAFNSQQETPLPSPGKGDNLFWSGDYMSNNDAFAYGDYNPSKIPDTSNAGANTNHPIDSLNPNGFWITNLGGKLSPNLFINNSVAGCQMQGRAYWVVKQSLPEKINNGFPKETSYPIFTGNRAHACYAGLDTDARMYLGVSNTTTSAPFPVPPAATVNATANAPVIVFSDLTLTRMRYKAFWTRGLFSSLLNSRLAANKQGATILGGGGPEGNLIGFWGLVKNNVFAGITNNNVDRYYDCNAYMENQKSAMTALGVENYNEASECVSFSNTPLTGDDGTILTNQNIANNIITLAGEASAINGNLQGYTYYDGPARLEYTRFVNFRVDATNQKNKDNDDTRYLSTRVDARKMLDLNNNIAQFGLTLNPSSAQYNGGNDHYGYEGDPAMAWIKGNSQSLPPTQYALGNMWENTDFKHQVFTETVNMANGISDGDKQTIILDKDGTLSGYQVCNAEGCNDAINHFPISLNNLNFYATPYTVDEPHAIGRNNVIASAMMSPHKYATINIETSPNEAVSAAPATGQGTIGNGAFNLSIKRDMPAYKTASADIVLYGRGGQPIFETFFMNNMGYTIYPTNNSMPTNIQEDLLFSYSDAPTDTTFINRVGVCLGTNVNLSDISVGRVLRQWGSTTAYLTLSPYWADMKNKSNCESIFNGKGTWATCDANTTKVSAITSGKTLKDINAEFLSLSALEPGDDINQSFYFDENTGILYFNMVQLGNKKSQLVDKMTPPYSLCDISQYSTQSGVYGNYLMFDNNGSIQESLKTACFYSNTTNTPSNSDLINCPKDGCVSYSVSTGSGVGVHAIGEKGNGNCSTPSLKSNIIAPSGVSTSNTAMTVNDAGQLVYASPYWLASTRPIPVIAPVRNQPSPGPTPAVVTSIAKVAVSNYLLNGISGVTQDFYFNCDRSIESPIFSDGLLPLTTLNCDTTNKTNLLSDKPVPPSWVLTTGLTTATISGGGFTGPPPNHTPHSSYSVTSQNSSGLFFASSLPLTVQLSIGASGSGFTCNNIILGANGTVDSSQCSDTFNKHLSITQGSKTVPTTLTATP